MFTNAHSIRNILYLQIYIFIQSTQNKYCVYLHIIYHEYEEVEGAFIGISV